MRKNSTGSRVTDLQRRLRLLGYELGVTGVDGIYGPRTLDAVKNFQQDRGLRVSGMVDSETWQELVDAGYKIGDRLLYLKNPPFRGDDVRTLQLWLKTLGFYPDKENGIFCQKTRKALVEFQDNMNIKDDGILGEQTLRHLKGLQRIIDEKKTSNFPYIRRSDRDRERPSLIILDYDPLGGSSISSPSKGRDSMRSLSARICANIAENCRQMLAEAGQKAALSFRKQNGGDPPGIFDRIAHANSTGGDYLISINLDRSSDSEANGCSCYYFKGLKSYSIGGYKLADTIQDHLVRGMDLVDCRVHGANYAILKNTEMISVVVEPAFITNQRQRDKIQDAGYQQAISREICTGLRQFLEG